MTIHEFNQFIAGHKPVLVDFYADWCEPCKWLDPVMDEISRLVQDKAITLRMDIEKYPELKAHYQIQSIPVLIIFKNGQQQWRMNGFTNAKDLSGRLLEYV